jgi:DNA transformation protein
MEPAVPAKILDPPEGGTPNGETSHATVGRYPLPPGIQQISVVVEATYHNHLHLPCSSEKVRSLLCCRAMAESRGNMSRLADLPNIGGVLAGRLEDVGIRTASQLKALGSIEALLRVRAQGCDEPCASMLYAVEGAIRGIRWHVIAAGDRASLWRGYQARCREAGGRGK